MITIARDENSATKNRQKDSTRNNERSDLLAENTDFHSLFSSERDDGGYYIENNIPASLKKGSYKNSSLKNIKDNNSKLSYKSSIVWPIRRFTPDNNGIQEPKCYGFLAIDSESRYVFNETWDIEIGAAITEHLFETFHIFSQLNAALEKHDQIK